MGIYLLIVGGLAGEGPGEIFSRFGAEIVSPALGIVSHLGMSMFHGALFGIAWSGVAGRIGWPTLGVLYGLAAYVLSAAVILPASGSPILGTSMVHWGISHVLYGLCLAWAYHRLNPAGG